MVHTLKKLRVLIWKCYKLRQRNWLLTAFELACPLLVAYLTYKVQSLFSTFEGLSMIKQNSSIKMDPPQNMFQPLTSDVCYTPVNEYTDQLMSNFNLLGKSLVPLQTEEDVETWLQKAHGLSFGIMLLEAGNNITSLKYKIRYNDPLGMQEISPNMIYEFGFLNVQASLINALLKTKNYEFSPPEITVRKLQQIDMIGIYFFIVHIAMVLAYSFLVASTVRDVVQEKCSGIKELMKIMGLSSWMIWVHWLIYTLMVHLIIIIVFTIILCTYILHANFILVFLLYFLFVLTCTLILFTLSCFFNNSSVAIAVCVFGWLIIHAATYKIIMAPQELTVFYQYLYSLIPLNNLSMTLVLLNSLEDSWASNLLTSGVRHHYVSVGNAIMIFIFEILVCCILIKFLDAVKPGPYGVAKPVTYFLQWPGSKPTEDIELSDLPDTFERPPKDAKVAVQIRGLRKTFGSLQKVIAVENVNLDMYKGEIMALLGHNGAGKTTTMSIITGMLSRTSGQILFDGKDISRRDSDFRDSLGLCTQHNLHFPKLTVIEHLIFFGMLKGMSHTEARNEAKHILELMEIHLKMNSKVSSLSGGMKRRLCFSVALIGKPNTIILDEPTSGLDPESRRKIWDLILTMRDDRQILITTHFMEEADVLGDRIAIMDHGRVVCCGTTMFLKKLYGTGYHIHVLKESEYSTEPIYEAVSNFVPSLEMKSISPTELEFVLKEKFLDSFPSLFSYLESNKIAFGINGISVTCTSLEDVFLKVADNTVEKDRSEESPVSKDFTLSSGKVHGFTLCIQQMKALALKHLKYRRRKMLSFLIKVVVTSLLILGMSIYTRNTLKRLTTVVTKKPLAITLGLHPRSVNPIVHDNNGKKIAVVAENIIKNDGGGVEILSQETNIAEYLIHGAYGNLGKFSKAIISISFEKEKVMLIYQDLDHVAAISYNILSNVLLQNYTGDDKDNIRVINHPIDQQDFCKTGFPSYELNIVVPLIWLLSFSLAFIIVMVDNVIFSLEERVSSFRLQQFLTGVSPLLFLVVKFTIDYIIFLLILITFLIIVFVVVSEFISTSATCSLVLILLIFGINGLLFTYIFSRIFNSPVQSNYFFTLGNLFISISTVYYIVQGSTQYFFSLLLATLNPYYLLSNCIFRIVEVMGQIYTCKECPFLVKECSNADKNLWVISDSKDAEGILIYIFISILSFIILLSTLMILDYGLLKTVLKWIFHASRVPPRTDKEDEDVKSEAKRVQGVIDNNIDIPLVVNGLSKKYFLGTKAVINVTFLVDSGECFGLLGVNGAGKTTTFRILTGDIIPDTGDVFIHYYSAISNRRIYQTSIGYCPQFDAILDYLTGNDILKIIALLRGIPQDKINSVVCHWLEVVGISEHALKDSVNYSGGTKRKLSTAMAFIGDPSVVFLDEPTTGVDPVSRRKLWKVIQERQRAGQAIVLTSHSMEECDTLCSRLTIMKDGQMKCIGTTEYLKSKFSQGYTVLLKLINPTQDEREQLKEHFKLMFPTSEVKDEHSTLIHYQTYDPHIKLSELFRNLLDIKDQFDIIEDFTASNTTLEQLFLSFAKS